MSAPIITVLDAANRPIGPLTIEEVQRRLQAGEFQTDQLAHAPGFSQWTPLHAVLAHVTSGQSLPTYLEPPAAAPVTAPNPAPAMTVPPVAARPTLAPFAGFWLRFTAYLLDCLILSIAYYAAAVALHAITPHAVNYDFRWSLLHPFQKQLDSKLLTEVGYHNFRYIVLLVAAFFCYGAVLESSPAQGTVGKMVVGLKVTDLQGARISFLHALGRNLAKWIPVILCCVFYACWLPAAFTARKQALHDMVAETLVLRK